jgi:hypothetical protein
VHAEEAIAACMGDRTVGPAERYELLAVDRAMLIVDQLPELST